MVRTVSTVNVNGLRAASGKGFLAWLAATPADVVCLQEVRAERDEWPAEIREPEGWHVSVAASDVKGRNGVAVFSRTRPEAVRVGFGVAEFDTSGRYVEVTLPGLVVASVYVPKGEVGTPRQDEKHRFLAGFLAYLMELREKADADGREVLVCGDWNMAHTELDLRAWRANQERSGFTVAERAWLDRLFDEADYVDVVRALNPDLAGPYTWWSYRGRAFDTDTGWRIDYLAASPGIAARAVSAKTERAADYGSRRSDHAPVTVTFTGHPPRHE